MPTAAHLITISNVALEFAANSIATSPRDILRKATYAQLLEYLEEVGEASGVDASVVQTITAHDRTDIEARFGSWANTIDVERKYGIRSEDEAKGWIVLALGVNDQLRAVAGHVDAAWA